MGRIIEVVSMKFDEAGGALDDFQIALCLVISKLESSSNINLKGTVRIHYQVSIQAHSLLFLLPTGSVSLNLARIVPGLSNRLGPNRITPNHIANLITVQYNF